MKLASIQPFSSVHTSIKPLVSVCPEKKNSLESCEWWGESNWLINKSIEYDVRPAQPIKNNGFTNDGADLQAWSN